MSCGIYGIHNLANDKWYIGQSVNIHARWDAHRSNLKLERNEPVHLIRAWKKYGAPSFEFVILEECLPEALDDREIYWIAKKNSFLSGYNRTAGGGGLLGVRQSPETIARRSSSLKKVAADPVYRANRSLLSKEMWTRPEYREKLLPIRQAAVSTPEYKRKISEISKTRYLDPKYRENYRRKLKDYYQNPANRESILEAAKRRGQDESRNKKIGEFHRMRYEKNSELRDKVSKESRERWADPSMREKMISAQKSSAQKRATPVLQVETGIIFPSMRAAADSIGGKSAPGPICVSCKNPARSAYGYHWRYA